MASTEEEKVNENNDGDEDGSELSEGKSSEQVAAVLAQAEDDPSAPMASDEEITWFLVGSGILLTLILLIRRPKRLIEWLIPLGLIGAGIFFIYRQGQILWNKREARKESALQVIQAELDALDPIAGSRCSRPWASSNWGLKRQARRDRSQTCHHQGEIP